MLFRYYLKDFKMVPLLLVSLLLSHFTRPEFLFLFLLLLLLLLLLLISSSSSNFSLLSFGWEIIRYPEMKLSTGLGSVVLFIF